MASYFLLMAEAEENKGENVSEINLEKTADIFKALSDPVRLSVLLALLNGPLNVGDVAEKAQIRHRNASLHLTYLRRMGFATVTRDGTARLYSLIQREKVLKILEAVSSD